MAEATARTRGLPPDLAGEAPDPAGETWAAATPYFFFFFLKFSDLSLDIS
jgi:hypothetical protein